MNESLVNRTFFSSIPSFLRERVSGSSRVFQVSHVPAKPSYWNRWTSSAQNRSFLIALNDSGGCPSIVAWWRSRQTPRTERFPRALPANTFGNVFHFLVSGSYSIPNAFRIWPQNVDCALRRSSVIPSFCQQPRCDVRLHFPQSQVRFPRAARGPGPSFRPVRRILASISIMMMMMITMMPDSLVVSLTDLVLDVRVTLPHEFLMIPAGPLQLPKHQFDIFERLAILRHSLCSVYDPGVTLAAPAALRPSSYKSLAFRSITFRVVAGIVTTLTLFRYVNETSCVARRRS